MKKSYNISNLKPNLKFKHYCLGYIVGTCPPYDDTQEYFLNKDGNDVPSWKSEQPEIYNTEEKAIKAAKSFITSKTTFKYFTREYHLETCKDMDLPEAKDGTKKFI